MRCGGLGQVASSVRTQTTIGGGKNGRRMRGDRVGFGLLHLVHLQQRRQRHRMGTRHDGGGRGHLHARTERVGLASSVVRSHLADERPDERLRAGRRGHVGQFPQHLANQQRLELSSTGHDPLDLQADQHRNRRHRLAQRQLRVLCLRLQCQPVQHHQLQHQQLFLELGRGLA